MVELETLLVRALLPSVELVSVAFGQLGVAQAVLAILAILELEVHDVLLHVGQVAECVPDLVVGGVLVGVLEL